MRSYSESVAQAADVVNSESEMDKQASETKNKVSVAQSKGAGQKAQPKAAVSSALKDDS